MPRCALTAALAVAVTLGGTVNVRAFSLDRYGEEETHGLWTVWCEAFDDMGGFEYLDCVVVGDATPQIVFAGLDGEPAVSRLESGAGGILSLGNEAYDLSGCPDDRCAVAETVGGLIARLTEAPLTLQEDAAAVPFETDGLATALTRAAALID